jgi:hypothetical protein
VSELRASIERRLDPTPRRVLVSLHFPAVFLLIQKKRYRSHSVVALSSLCFSPKKKKKDGTARQMDGKEENKREAHLLFLAAFVRSDKQKNSGAAVSLCT